MTDRLLFTRIEVAVVTMLANGPDNTPRDSTGCRLGRKVTLTQLVAATYLMVAGGPYGLEGIVGHAGYNGAILILLITPLVWSVPTALMVSELSSALPESGGYYAWVKRALGPFWGFQEAWLSLVASIFDMAIYPTLFAVYLAPSVRRWVKGLAQHSSAFSCSPSARRSTAVAPGRSEHRRSCFLSRCSFRSSS